MGKILLLALLLIGQLSWASQGLSSSAQLMSEMGKARNFAQFIKQISPETLPGDAAFLSLMLQKNQNLAEEKPKLIFENNVWTVRMGARSVSFKVHNMAKSQWLINNAVVEFYPWALAPERWKLLAQAVQSKKAIHFSFLPVARAEADGEPTTTLMTTFAVISQQTKTAGISVGQTVVGRGTVDQLLQKAGGTGDCTRATIAEAVKTVGALAPDEIICSDKASFMTVKFKGPKLTRFVRLSRTNSSIVVTDEEMRSSEPLVHCQFDLANWSSDKCSADQARIEQLKAWVQSSAVQSFCLKCRPLIETLSAKSSNKRGRY